jgi:hypothetical protein
MQSTSPSLQTSLGLWLPDQPANPPSPPRGVPEVYLNLATTMSNVQITPTRMNAVKPIRIHCSGVRCFQIISGLAPRSSHMMRGQYIAVRLRPRFVTRPRMNAVLDRQGANTRWPEFGFLPGLSTRARGSEDLARGYPAPVGPRTLSILFQKLRQFETANVSAKTICLPQKMNRTSGSASARRQAAQSLLE